MTLSRVTTRQDLLIDKQMLRRAVAELDAQLGFVVDPQATPQRSRDMMLADGIRPETNEFSRDIIAGREE